ncbi:MAG: Rieske 2Fe-2S domain-containing protein [Dehalococcoidia bacterium]|nr:Rieske 2Fe-2S domain-containing protein [Dehalococcoidia bacterium]
MGFLVGFLKALFGICVTKPLNPESWSLEDGKVRMKLGGVSELSREGGAVYLQGQGLDKPILIVRARDDKYLAFTNSCPHLHRRIDQVPGKPLLRCCSIMHSTFDYEGRKVTGPANGGLTKHEAELEEGELIVKI